MKNLPATLPCPIIFIIATFIHFSSNSPKNTKAPAWLHGAVHIVQQSRGQYVIEAEVPSAEVREGCIINISSSDPLMFI